GDGSVLRIATRGESIGLRVVDHIDLGHRQLGACCKFPHDAIVFWRVLLIDLDGVVHAQYHLVGVPVAEQVHASCDHEGDKHPALTADQIPYTHEQSRHQGEKH